MPSDNERLMLIHRAIKQGNLVEVQRLLDDDKSRLCMWTPFGTWLHDAASYGQLPIVRWLVSVGVDIDAYNESNESTPLCNAAANGHVDVVKFLVDSGAALDVTNSVRNALFAAIVGGSSNAHIVAKLLIDGGIDTSIRYANLDGMNASDYAREWGRSDIVAVLETR